MTREQKSEILERREYLYPAWRITKRRTTELTGIKKYPYRAIICGYWVLLDKNKKEKMPYHKYIWIRHYKKYPKPGYHIHHRDGIKLNNDIDNLRLMKKHDHLTLHEKVWKQVSYLRRRRKHGIRSAVPA